MAEQTAAATALRAEVAQLQLDIKDLQEALGQADDGVVRCAARARAHVRTHAAAAAETRASPPPSPPPFPLLLTRSRRARARRCSASATRWSSGVRPCSRCVLRAAHVRRPRPLLAPHPAFPPNPSAQVWDERSAELTALQASVDGAAAELCESVSPAFAAVGAKLTAARAAAYRGEVARLAAAKDARRGAMAELCKEIAALWADYDGAPADGDAVGCAALAGVDAAAALVGWGPAAVAALEAKCGELQAEVADREARVTALGTELTRLWHHLCVPEAEQRAFLERHAGISDATFDVVTTAIARMQADFAARLTELLAGVRTRIAACWDEMRAGDTQRAEMFGAFFAPTPGACAGASASGRPARARAAPPTASPFLPPFPSASPALRPPQSPRRKSCTWSTSGTWRT